MIDPDPPVDLDASDPYWARRHAEFVAVVEALLEEGFGFSVDTRFRDCFVSRYLVARFGELTDSEIATIYDLSRQRIGALAEELLTWLRLPMHHALNRDVTVASIRKHLRQQELIF